MSSGPPVLARTVAATLRHSTLAPLLFLAACATAPDRPDRADGGPVAKAEPAAAKPPGVFERCHRPGQDEVILLDDTRRLLEETVCGATLWFDGLFGDGDIRPVQRTHGRVEVTASHSEFEGEDTKVRFSARVRLPALQERLSAFVGLGENEDVARDRSEGVGLRSDASQLDEVEDFFAGVGYVLFEDYGIHTDFRVGVRGLRRPKAFAQTRMIYVAYVDDVNLVELRLTPFVNTTDGLGITASTDFDHALAPTRLLRWGSIGTVSEKSAGLDWRSALILYQSLLELRALAFETFVRGATAAPEPLTEYGLRTIYRHPLFRARLFANLILGYSWPRVDPTLPRDGSAAVSLGLELPFGVKN